MRRFLKQGIGTLGICLLAAGCVQHPKGVMTDKKMAPVLADMELAEAYINSMPGCNPKEREAMMNDIIEKHGLTRSQFDSTMAWYGRNVDAYSDLLDLTDRELKKKSSQKLKGQEAPDSKNTNENDLWTGSRMSVVSPLSGLDSYNFSLPVSELKPGQRLALKMRLSEARGGYIMIGVAYENGTYGYASRGLSGSRRVDLVLQTDTGMRVKSIFGNLQFTDPKPERPLWIDSISLKALDYDSTQYYNIHGQRIWRPVKYPPRNNADSQTADTVAADRQHAS